MKRKNGMPDLVYFLLLGIRSRVTAYVWAIFSLLTAIVFLMLYAGAKGTPVAFIYGLGFVSFLVAASSYYYAIRWGNSMGR